MTQNDIATYGATQINVGLSAIIKVAPSANQYGTQLRVGSGGSLEIVQTPIALTGSSATGWGTGFLVTGTVSMINGPAAYYLAATGATVTVQILNGYTSGVTLI